MINVNVSRRALLLAALPSAALAATALALGALALLTAPTPPPVASQAADPYVSFDPNVAADGSDRAQAVFLTEDAEFHVTVYLSKPAPPGDVSVRVGRLLLDQFGRPRLDTNPRLSKVVHIGQGFSMGTVTLRASKDEVQGTFPRRVRLGITPINNARVHPDAGLFTIFHQDDDIVTVDFARDEFTRATAVEGEMVTLTLHFRTNTRAASAPLTVRFDGGLTGTRTFEISERRAQTFQLTFMAPDNLISGVPPPPVTVTLIDDGNVKLGPGPRQAVVRFRDDDPIPRVGFVGNRVFTAGENEMVTLRAELQPGVTATRTIEVGVRIDQVEMRTFEIASGTNFGLLTVEVPGDNSPGQVPGFLDIELVDDDNEQYDLGHNVVNITPVDDDMIRVGFDQTSYTFTEGEQVTVRVEALGEVSDHVNIPVNVFGIPGPGGVGQTRNVMLSATNRFADITFMAPEDDIANVAPGKVSLSITPTMAVDLGPGAGATSVWFRDDDPVASVGFAGEVVRAVEEGDSITLAVELANGVEATRTVSVVVDDGSNQRTLTINEGGTSAVLTLMAPEDDAANVAPAPLTFMLATPNNAALTTAKELTTINVRNDDPLASVEFWGGIRPEVVEGETVTLQVGLQPGLVASRAIEVRVSGFPGGSPRMVTIPQGGRYASPLLTFTAPDDDVIDETPELRLALEVEGDEAQVHPHRGELRPILYDREALVEGAAARGGTLAGSSDFHRWIFEVSGTERQFVILQATGSHPQGSAPARVRAELYDGAVRPYFEGWRLVATADDLTRYGPSDDDRHQYFRIERWLEPGIYALEVSVDGDNPPAQSETYELLVDVVTQEITPLTFGLASTPQALMRANDAPLRGRSVPYYYRFEVPAQARGTTTTIESTASSNSDPVARLLNGQGEFIAESSKLDDDTTGNMFKFERMLEPGVYYLAVQSFVDGTAGASGSQLGGNVYSLPDPIGIIASAGERRVAQFAPTNPTTAPENNEITLTVELADAATNGVAATNLTLNVEYSGGGGYMGPATVTIPAGATTGTVQLRVPGTAMAGTVPPPLTVTLRDGIGVGVSQTASTLMITLTENDPVLTRTARFDPMNPTTAPENDEITLMVELADAGGVAGADLTLNVGYSGGGGYTGPATVTIPANAISGALKLRVPGTGVVGTVPPPLTVTLRDGVGVDVVPAASMVMITLTENDPARVARFDPMNPTTAPENDEITLMVELADAGGVAGANLTLNVEYSGGGGYMGTATVTIPANATSGALKLRVPGTGVVGTVPPPLTVTLRDGVGVDADPAGSMVMITLTENDPARVARFATTNPTTAPENDEITLMVELADAGGAAGADLTLNVGYSGGGGYTGPTTVTIPANATSGALKLRVPGTGVVGTVPPPLTVMLRDGIGVDADTAGSTAVITLTENDPARVARFATTNPTTAPENDEITLMVELADAGGVAGANLTLNVEYSGGGGYMGTATVTIPAGATSGALKLRVPGTGVVGTVPPPLTVMLRDGIGVDADTAGSTAVIMLTENDPARVARFASMSPTTALENAEIMLTVELADAATGGVARAELTLGVEYSGGGGYTGPLMATIPAGATSTVLLLRIPGDSMVGTAPPPLTVTLRDGPGVEVDPDPAASTVMITLTNSDQAVTRVARFATTNPTMARENDDITLTVELADVAANGVAGADLTLNVEYSGGGYTGPTTVTIPQDATNGALQLRIPGTAMVGTVPPPLTVTLRDGPGVDVDTAGSTVVITLTENDPVRVARFAPQNPTMARENDDITLTVELADVATNGMAGTDLTLGVEYSGGGGYMGPTTVTIPQNAANGTLQLRVPGTMVAGTVPDPLTVTLRGVPGVDVDTAGSTVVITLTENDPARMARFASMNPTTAPENAEITLTVELTDVAANGVAGADLTLNVEYSGGYTGPTMVTIPVGDTNGTFKLRVPGTGVAGTVPPPLTVTLRDGLGVDVVPAGSMVMITLTENDPVFRLVSSDVEVVEGGEVTLVVMTEGGVAVTERTELRVELGDGRVQTVTFRPGQSSAALMVQTEDNQRAGRALMLAVRLVSSSRGSVASAASATTITIEDDGDPVARVGFASTSQQVLQGGLVKFVAQLNVVATETIELQIMFNDGRAPQTVTIMAGQSSAEVLVPTSSSGPAPPPLRLTIGLPEGQPGVLNVDAAVATLVQTPPLVGADILPSAGGVALGWGALVALLALALALAATGALLLRPRRGA